MQVLPSYRNQSIDLLIVTEKYKEGITVTKARLVARSFEEDDLDRLRNDSSTCGKESIGLLFVVLASNGWKIHSLDIKFAAVSKLDEAIFF